MTAPDPDPALSNSYPNDALVNNPTKVSDPNSPAPDGDQHANALTQVAPDFVEQEIQEEIDNIVPTRGYQMTPMVGLGGSAGCIPALQAFFKAMPADSGMVFVVVLHLSPSHHSTMADLLGRFTTMPVAQAEDGQKAEANRVYVIPPGKHLATVNGHLRLFEQQHEKGKRVAVDLFFRSLADTHGPHAAAIVLSGADGDGANGIKRIKERGGLTVAQDPDEAEHPSMPTSAIDTGMVDWVLQVEQMPQRLLAYQRNEQEVQLPPEEGPQPAGTLPPHSDANETALRDVLVFLRTRTGRDFSYYKRATILRRIGRRMQVNSIATLPDYLVFLRTHPGESGALLQDLLISVTNFFRDREAFAALEKTVIPALFEGKSSSDTVRVWVPACATGEEAYSIAMLLVEHASKLSTPPTLQIFACDLDSEAIQDARAGLYSLAIAADVSEERLGRFFVKDHRGYRVRRELREMVLFAVHDLLKDAPFSRIDLVSCRNLLIYLNRPAQIRALETFRFALRGEGRLFLGSSETVDEGSPLFRTLDKKNRLFEVKSSGRVVSLVPSATETLQRAVEAQERTAFTAPVIHGKDFEEIGPGGTSPRPPAPDRAAIAEMHYRLIERFAPPSLVVDAGYGIVHLSENAGRFLQFVGGGLTNDLLKLILPSLRQELRSALFRAAESRQAVEVRGVPANMDGRAVSVDFHVSPAPDLAAGYLLIVLTTRPAPPDQADAPASGPAADTMANQFERELLHSRAQLRETVEQYEASNEEMKASNEELQAMNEELRSATEELETSREELQSINEELVTVNQEMKGKVDELAHANSDLQNLMASTSIATVFLDRQLVVMRYTPSVDAIFYLIPGDVGRPLAHLKHRLDYPELIDDAERVLRSLVPVEREVCSDLGDWFLAHFQPYRTLEDHIAGVVMTFVNVTDRKRAERELEQDLQASERLRRTSERLVPDGDMRALYNEILDTAVSITGAAAGTLQLLEPATHDLRLLAAQGLSAKMTERFQIVPAGSGTVCGVAMTTGQPTVMNFDAPGALDPKGDLRAHLEAGLRSAQATPLISRAGQPLGMLTTHWPEHRRLTERERRFLDLLARQAADALERQIASEVLRHQMEELTRFNETAAGRESRLLELQQEVNALLTERGEPIRYARQNGGDGEA